MSTIHLLPPSPSAPGGAETFPWPAQTTHVIISTGAPRLVKAARSLPTQAREKPACELPPIPADRSHGAIVFAVMFAAAAATIYLSALAMLDLAASQGAAVSEPPTGQPPRSGAHFEGAR